MLELEGVLLAEGKYTDKSGRTIYYSADVIERALASFLGVPYVYPHSEDKNDVLKVGGFTSETWMEHKTGMYRAYVYKSDIIEKISAGLLPATSIEASISTAYDPEMKCEVATAMVGEALAGTNRPACGPCQIHSHRMVTSVRLENKNGGERKMSNNGENDNPELEPEVTPTLPPPTPQPLAVPPEPPLEGDALLEKIKEMIKQAYPMPKTTPWGEMSDNDKFKSCVLFFKNKGYPYPYPTAKPTKKEDPMTSEKVWDWPKWFPEETKQWMLDAEKKITELTAEVQKTKDAITERDKTEVQREVAAIKELNPGFDPKKFLEGEECPNKQKKMLERYHVELEVLIPKFKLEGVTVPVQGGERLDKICMDAFGMNFETVMKSVGEPAPPAQEGK